jgi:hypothetical protein
MIPESLSKHNKLLQKVTICIHLSVNEALIHGIAWLEFQTMMYATYSKGL